MAGPDYDGFSGSLRLRERKPNSFVAPTKTAKNRIKTKMAMINVVISFASFAKDKKNL